MTKLNKLFKWGLPVIAVTSTAMFVVSCGTSDGEITKKLLKSLESDEKAKALKTSLSGYSTDSMEIIANKQEITEQSKQLIAAFNEFYGTKLKFTQVGGTQDIGQYYATKFATGVGNVLMVSTGSLGGFEKIKQHLVDTPASKMLVDDNTSKGEFVIEGKHFMPATIESIGVIYNKDVFAKAKITVYEGKGFDDATSKPATLVKPTTDYNGTITDGDKLYVFTDDLTLAGYKALVAKLKAENVKPVYTTSKTPKGNIWPITNHLLGAAVNAKTGLTPVDESKLKDPAEMMNLKVINAAKDALELYGHNEEYNKTNNTVALAMINVATGEYAMSQNGSWATPEIKKAKKDAKVGFLPLPIFNETDNTAMMYQSVSQRWAATTLADDEAKLKTAKLFLQFMYQTKSGLEISANDLQMTTPFKSVEGVQLSLDDPLAASTLSYTGNDLGETVDNYFVTGFNNGSEVLISVTNGGFAGGESDVTKLTAEINRLKTVPKKEDK